MTDHEAATAQPEVTTDKREACGGRAEGGPCILPRAHNMGKPDVPSNHLARRQGTPVTQDELVALFANALDVQGGHIYPEFSRQQAHWVVAALLAEYTITRKAETDE